LFSVPFWLKARQEVNADDARHYHWRDKTMIYGLSLASFYQRRTYALRKHDSHVQFGLNSLENIENG
jgi:hypothetical protein